ncbi:holo-[acyl-carrier-protein] synthase [Geothermobacter hydrogeniphilus]|uniref:Holo-[acyl-carrier-protein] synthase n=1 Tax=Geothermobacter hydrogeniphilus TaxID=1969733 RepID=A0A2K2HE40_9BACT|nr:holo-ACP synthase [Geothermobacter hydrogeniphilus]PNU21565.1 holo-[acyl-carrier-protein] synthase [Geothermobacter hydrogeniphilus]
MQLTSSIAGLGVDLVRISRFEKLLADPARAVLGRLFTASERDDCLARAVPARHFAARFAAKEALLKAYGLGLRQGLSWQDMEVVRDALGKPSFVLTGTAAELQAERGLLPPVLSYSHDGDYAMATVILEKSCES